MYLKLKRKVIDHLGYRIGKIRFNKYCKLQEDERKEPEYKLLYFCGQSSINFLNASLISVYKSWKLLPNIIIVTDGTPTEYIKANLIKWPKNVYVCTWEECGAYYKQKGNIALYQHALQHRWPARKLVSLLYFAEKFPVLYSDTDVLWYSDIDNTKISTSPFLRMGEDIEKSYTYSLLKSLGEENIRSFLNSGVMYMHGDFSSYPKWDILCNSLLKNPDEDNFAEQTAFALLHNYFDSKNVWNLKQVVIEVDDKYDLRFNRHKFSDLIARHHVGNKDVTFWRDFTYIYLFRRSRNLRNVNG